METLRLLDANFNRAGEALRVMEDHARFVLDDAQVTGAIKTARHVLAACIPQPLRSRMLAARRVATDVGTTLTTPSEQRRGSTEAVAVAAARRLGEALRCLEEYLKLLDPDAAGRIKQLRYRGYELERALDARRRAKASFGRRRLYVIITEALCTAPWRRTAEAVLDGGADVLQLREKGLPDREVLSRARDLGSLCRGRGALFILNDRPDLAALAGADGVHLGQDDLPASEARRIVGPDAILGVSTHTIEQVRAACDEHPDYVAVGPMFASPTKPQPVVPGPTLLGEALGLTSLPLVAIGGIDENAAGQLRSIAPCCLCVCSAVIAQADAREATRRLHRSIEGQEYARADAD
jgi:thiamine-phosphate pyrophosphorylase